MSPAARAVAALRRRAGFLVCCLVMLITFVGHDAASSSQAGGDSILTTYQSMSLLRERTLTLEPWRDEFERDPPHSELNDHGDLVYTFPGGRPSWWRRLSASSPYGRL